MLNEVIKIDLHIHTIASAYKEPDGFVTNSTADNLNILFEKLDEYDISMISFTDHNKFNKEVYLKAKELVDSKNYSVQSILPGIEFDVEIDNSHFHLITYFDCMLNDESLSRICDTLDLNPIETARDKYSAEELEEILRKIGYPVILLGYQNSGDFECRGGNDYSNAYGKDIASEQYLYGYLNGFEVSNSKVEGILNSTFLNSSRALPIPAVYRHDCHDWELYPYHDEDIMVRANRDGVKPIFTRIKALPTFKGLLMSLSSPNTRFSRSTSVSHSYLDYFEFDGNKFEMSPGINVIVGENGAGKSSLMKILTNTIESDDLHVRKFKELHHIKLGKKIEVIESVQQGQLYNEYLGEDSNSLVSEFYPVTKADLFKKDIGNYVDSIHARIKSQIDFQAKSESMKDVFLKIDDDFLDKTHYVTAEIVNFEPTDNGDISARISQITRIIGLLTSEIDTGYYSADLYNDINEALKLLNGVLEKLKKTQFKIQCIDNVKESIKIQFKNYQDSINNRYSSEDNNIRVYRDSRNRFIDRLKELVKAQCLVSIDFPKFVYNEESYNESKEIIRRGGYKFVTYRKFYPMGKDALLNSLLEELFIRQVSSSNYEEKLRNINTEVKFKDIVRGAGNNNSPDIMIGQNKDKFLENVCKREVKLFEVDDNNEVYGNTLGEQSLCYYKILLDNEFSGDSQIVAIDQPEDNISNNKIRNKLIPSLQNASEQRQVILITHNPMLVINLDADNVIVLKNEENGKTQVSAGCLEDEDSGVLIWVRDYMDGGRETIEHRLKVYR